jgi:two-component system, NarL family, nitrate/nitrite response regulator NarL
LRRALPFYDKLVETVGTLQDVVPIRLAVQSSRRLVGDTLVAYFSTLPDLTVVGRIPGPASVISLCMLRRPDVLLLDAGERPADAFRTLVVLRQRFPQVRAVLLYDRLSAEQLGEARAAGATVLVPSTHGLEALLAQVRQRAPATVGSPRTGSGLTDRELEIIMLLGCGHSVPEIAALLGIAAETVENHKRRIYAKLQAKSAVHAVARAASLGLLPGAPSGPSAGDDRWPMVVVVRGHPGTAADRVMRILVEHQIPGAREYADRASRRSHWERWQRGLVTTVLVDPGADAWRHVATFGRPTVVVSSAADRGALLATPPAEVAALVQLEDAGQQLVPALAQVAQDYLRTAAAAGRPATPPVDLTARECDILESISAGHTVRQTAHALGIAPKTVENTQARLFGKLGVRNRAGALAAAYALGLLQPADADERTGS